MSHKAKRLMREIRAIRISELCGIGPAYPAYIAAARKLAGELISKGA